MNIVLIAAVLIVLFAFQGIMLWLVLKNRSKESDATSGVAGSDSLMLLQNQMEKLERSLDSRMAESSRQIQDNVHRQITESNSIIQNVTERLTKLDETNRQVVSFADQLQHLQDILQNPKQRGILGEYYLETVLQNVLPPGSYKMQYPFAGGEIVDAVVFVKEKIIPIDSKFSLENYNRALEARDRDERERHERAFRADLKARIDETSKYVRPEENTMEFAFMFIPSEGVYYDLLTNQVGAAKTQTRDLIEYAFQKKVIIVSPTSFLAYLQTVLQGLKALQIEEQAQEIRKQVENLGRHIGAWDEYYRKLGIAITTTVSHYNSGSKELVKIDKDVYKITGGTKIGIEANLLEKPGEIDEE